MNSRYHETKRLVVGQQVTYSGYPGRVKELYIDGDIEAGRMYNVQLKSGGICVCGSDLISV